MATVSDYNQDPLEFVPFPGSHRNIDENLFKVSIDTAINFLKNFKGHVEEKLWQLVEIRSKKNFRKQHPELENSQEIELSEKLDEEAATYVFEILEIELKRWSFGNAGISLKKEENQDECGTRHYEIL